MFNANQNSILLSTINWLVRASEVVSIFHCFTVVVDDDNHDALFVAFVVSAPHTIIPTLADESNAS